MPIWSKGWTAGKLRFQSSYCKVFAGTSRTQLGYIGWLVPLESRARQLFNFRVSRTAAERQPWRDESHCSLLLLLLLSLLLPLLLLGALFAREWMRYTRSIFPFSFPFIHFGRDFCESRVESSTAGPVSHARALGSVTNVVVSARVRQ